MLISFLECIIGSMASSAFDQTDAKLLDLIQREFPLVARPFDVLAERLGVTPSEVIERLTRLKSDRVIRQISAIFDSARLGYSSALAAFRVRPDVLDQVAERVSLHRGVSHCYSRDAEFNLWFTITLPPEKDLAHEVDELARIVGVEAHLALPALRIFKIGVFFEMDRDSVDRESTRERQHQMEPSSDMPVLSRTDRAAVRALQKDIPLVVRPFAELAAGVEMTEDDLLARAKRFLETGAMRRFAAVLRHRSAGYTSNAMVCWKADGVQIETAGAVFAAHPSVSHCYERPVDPDWPYALYTMVHARSDGELEHVVSRLATSSQLSDYRVLRSIREYKKSRVVYFD